MTVELSPAAFRAPGTSRRGRRFTVHTLTSGESSFLSNAFVVESATAVVVVDAMMVRSEARRVRALVETIDKPLAGVIVTHGHPDHYAGAADILENTSTPLLATVGVAAAIARDDEARDAKWKRHFGVDWPDVRPQPNQRVVPGSVVDLGGLRWQVREYGAGESHCDSVWVVEGRAAFIGDLCFNGVHAFLSDGHSTAWLATLNRLDEEFGGLHAYTGHGADGDLSSMCRAQSAYLQAYRDAIRGLADGRSRLRKAAKAALRARMIDYLGSDRLAEFIVAGADAVAAELAGQVQTRIL